MYDSKPAIGLRARPLGIVALAATLCAAAPAASQVVRSDDSVIRKIAAPSEKLEITTNSSRILTLEKRIPRVQVNNPDLLSVTPLSATQVQVTAKQPGVTAVNLWDEEDNVHTVDVFIYGDVRELQHALETQFPNSSVKVYRYSNALVLTGFIDRPDYVTPIVQLAQDYSPKVINNIQVGGVQQVLLKVKLYEVSRNKLRELGVDWGYTGPNGGFALNSVNDILSFGDGEILTNNLDTFSFGIVENGQSFFTMLDALQQNRVAKILAEPNLVAVSGRPAKFVSGGEIAYQVAQGGVGQTTFTVEFREFGTIVDFLPLVLGNGNIRLEVRPEVKTPDPTLGTTSNGSQIPGFRKRFVETAVEMKAGQTFAIAGLVDRRVSTSNRGLPIVSDIPFLGVPFRKTEDTVDEVELLVMVTPEFVDPMDAHEVPTCPPGTGTISPNNCELYCRGHVEVPNPCNECGGYPCVPTHGHVPCCPEGCMGGPGAIYGGAGEVIIQDGAAYPMEGAPEGVMPPPADAAPEGAQGATTHGELTLPPGAGNYAPGASAPADRVRETEVGPNGREMSPLSQRPATHYAASRNPQYRRGHSQPFNRQSQSAPADGGAMIGPVGYDVE